MATRKAESAKRVSVIERERLIRVYIPRDKVKRFWVYYDSYVVAPDGADNYEAYMLWSFISHCLGGFDTRGWGIDADNVFRPYIYLMDGA